MPVPATLGKLCTKIDDMNIGDYIKIGLNGSTWTIDFGTTECPVGGKTPGSWVSGDFYYAIKVARGLLVADRVTNLSGTWDALNSSKLIQGVPLKLYNSVGDVEKDVIYRSLTGGVAYADANGNRTTVISSNGAWPRNNEFDTYINNFPQELILPGKTSIDVFNSTLAFSWCQETPINGSAAGQGSTGADNTRRVARAHPDILGTTRGFGIPPSNYSGMIHGFRPVFEYKEV